MNDDIILARAIEQLTKAIMTLQHINDEYIFDYIQSEYETMNDIRTELTNCCNKVRDGEYND